MNKQTVPDDAIEDAIDALNSCTRCGAGNFNQLVARLREHRQREREVEAVEPIGMIQLDDPFCGDTNNYHSGEIIGKQHSKWGSSMYHPVYLAPPPHDARELLDSLAQEFKDIGATVISGDNAAKIVLTFIPTEKEPDEVKRLEEGTAW